MNRTLLSGLRATLVLPNPTLVNFYFGMGIFLGEPVKKHLLQFYFYPYVDDYDPTTPILYNVHTYKTEFGSTVKKSTGPKKEINARPQDNFALSIPKRKAMHKDFDFTKC